MAQVTVTVHGKNYTLACDDGEEDHLTELAREIDKRIAQLKPDVGAAGEAHLLLMAGLVVADDLVFAAERIHELEEELAGLKNEFLSDPKGAKSRSSFDEEKFAGMLESAARRMEDIAGRLA
jgi:cell division protein ZapA